MANAEGNNNTSQAHNVQQIDDLYLRNLFDDSTIFTNDNSFQSLVQTMRNEDQNGATTQFNMPTELEHLFNNDNDDVLANQPQNGIFQQGTPDFMNMWNDNSTQNNLNAFNITPRQPQPQPQQQQPQPQQQQSQQQQSQPQQQSYQQSQQQQMFDVNRQTNSFFNHIPMNTTQVHQQQQQQQQQQQPQPQQQQQQQNPRSLPNSQPVTPTQNTNVTAQTASSGPPVTFLDSLTAQLPPDRKMRINQLFIQLQNNTISAEHFLSQSKYLLDERGYQMLENLRNQIPSNNNNNNNNNSNTNNNNNNNINSNNNNNQNKNINHIQNNSINHIHNNVINNNINNNNNNNNKIATPTYSTSSSPSSISSSTPLAIPAIPIKSESTETNSTKADTAPAKETTERKRSIQTTPTNKDESQKPGSNIATPRMKKIKTDHSAPGTPMGPPPKNNTTNMNIATPALPNTPTTTSSTVNNQTIATPEFKPPAPPSSQGLQVPRTNTNKQSSTTNTSSTPSASAAAPSGSGGGSGGGGDNRIDYDAITDVMGYAGVDLREEVENFFKDGDGSALPVDGIDRSKTQDFMNSHLLQEIIQQLAKPLSIPNIDPDVIVYLSLATQDRLRGLMEKMVNASKHRVQRRSPFQQKPPISEDGDFPMYKVVVKPDTKQVLKALEKVDSIEQNIYKHKYPSLSFSSTALSPKSSSSSLLPPSSSSSQLKSETLIKKVATEKEEKKEEDDDYDKDEDEDEEDEDEDKKRFWKLKEAPKDGVDKSLLKQLKDATLKQQNDQEARKVTVLDAIFALENECQYGKGSGKNTLLKMYNKWLQK